MLLEDRLELETAKSFVPEPSGDPPPRLQGQDFCIHFVGAYLHSKGNLRQISVTLTLFLGWNI